MTWITDPSNESRSHFRNRIRLARFSATISDPDPGDRFAHEGWHLEVVEMDRRRVARVRLRRQGGAR